MVTLTPENRKATPTVASSKQNKRTKAEQDKKWRRKIKHKRTKSSVSLGEGGGDTVNIGQCDTIDNRENYTIDSMESYQYYLTPCKCLFLFRSGLEILTLILFSM